MKYSVSYYYRKMHRYFGVLIGIQFIFWTLGGIFFAWSDIDQIHGDINRKPEKLISDLEDWKNPLDVLNKISLNSNVDSLLSFKVINFLNNPFYQVRYFSNGEQKVSLVNSKNGNVRAPLSKQEAEQLASQIFSPESKIESTKYLVASMVNKHHEYRGRPLPAYAIKFEHESETKVYVSTEYGQVMTFRNSNWRIFDFLWMMHTMDYKGRDNFGNYLLKIFSILGLITIITGFILFFRTGRRRNRSNKLNRY